MPSPHVLIAGGGVAALETALALRAVTGGGARVTLLTPATHFAYRPLSVGAPFGLGGAVRYELEALGREGGFEVRRGSLERVRARERAVEAGEHRIAHDALVLALGARPIEAVDGALTFTGPASVPRLAGALRGLAETGDGRAAFVVPAGVAWTLPAYELALMTATWAAERGLALRSAVVTPERAPLAAMGAPAGDVLAEALARRGVELHLATACRTFFGSHLRCDDGTALRADLAVALPMLLGPATPGVAHDPLGFADVDRFGRVRGAPGVYAVGDGASHPVKQGGLATQQADLAAEHVAHALGLSAEEPRPADPVLRAMVMAGDERIWLSDRQDAALPAPAESGDIGPWWPPHKIAGRYLGPFLLAHQYLQEPPDHHPQAAAAAG